MPFGVKRHIAEQDTGGRTPSFPRTRATVRQPTPLDLLTGGARQSCALRGRLKGAPSGDDARRARDPRGLPVASLSWGGVAHPWIRRVAFGRG